jgi:methyl-accepting chemotaxis protein
MESGVVAENLFFVMSPRDGVVTAVSRALLDLLAYERDEVLGKSHVMMMDPSFAISHEYAACWTAVTRGGHEFAKMKLVGKDKGKPIWVHCCFNPILDSLGMVCTIKMCCLDVTAELTRNVEAHALIGAFESTQAVAVFGMDGTILDANARFLELLGYSLNELRGRYHNVLVEQPFATRSGYSEFWERLGNGVVQTGEFKHIGRGGREVWLLASYIPLPDLSGKWSKVVMQAVDIGKQKATDYAKNLLLANMSHEVRTPMNGIFGMLALEGQGGGRNWCCVLGNVPAFC